MHLLPFLSLSTKVDHVKSTLAIFSIPTLAYSDLHKLLVTFLSLYTKSIHVDPFINLVNLEQPLLVFADFNGHR
jgi:hypothetical protein